MRGGKYRPGLCDLEDVLNEPIIRRVGIALLLAIVVWVILAAVGFAYAGACGLIVFIVALLFG